ncbi:MAG: hypothetical protein LC106_08160 [Burkholderiales bacterium]|nr:hypothetical protein [Burkholderiales bacterium]
MNYSSQTTNKPMSNSGDLRNLIEVALNNKGYTRVPGLAELVPGTYTTNKAVSQTIYGRPFSTDFVVITKSSMTLFIESRWQQASGSIDEKFPFLSANLIAINKPTILILDGNGYTNDAYTWLKESFIGTQVTLHTLASFQALLNTNTLL